MAPKVPLAPFLDWLPGVQRELEIIEDYLASYAPEDNGALMSEFIGKFIQHLGRLSRLSSQATEYRSIECAPIINEGVEKHLNKSMIDLLIQANAREVWLVSKRIEDLSHNLRASMWGAQAQLNHETAILRAIGLGQTMKPKEPAPRQQKPNPPEPVEPEESDGVPF